MSLSVQTASCRQKTLSSADETSAARCSRVRLALRRFMAPLRVQSWRSKLSMNRSSESGRGLPHSKTQARPTCFRASARSWTAPVLWRFGFRCRNGFRAPLRVQSWRLKLSMGISIVPPGLGVRQSSKSSAAMRMRRAVESGRGLPHSKTLTRWRQPHSGSRPRCGSKLP